MERLEIEAEIERLEKEAFEKLTALRAARTRLAALDGRDLREEERFDELCAKIAIAMTHSMGMSVTRCVRENERYGMVSAEEVIYSAALWNPFRVLDDPEIMRYLAGSPLCPTIGELRARGVGWEGERGSESLRLIHVADSLAGIRDKPEEAVRIFGFCEKG